ncbi:MAG: SDR family oxidoreductase, partial [Nanoarchaeota archaeon]|nr:SDR family oxidoreductase [Nanoarchaeota archaeon]
LGSIGLRHARLLKTHFNNHDLYAFRSNKNSKKNQLGINEVYDIGEIDKINPDIAFITNPTSKHIFDALFCAKKGMKLFIEKPLSNNEKNIQELIRIIKERDLVTYVTYNLRFHPAIVWLKNYNKKTPLERMANTDEIASATLFLASDAASYITGTTFMVDGGWTSI